MEKENKKMVQDEILAILNDTIENELDAMGDFYTIAEISKEVLLNWSQNNGKEKNE